MFDYKTRRNAEELFPVTSKRPVMHEKSLEYALSQSYKLLKANKLIPSNLLKQSNDQTKTFLKKLNTLYIVDYKHLFEVFF